MGYPQIEVKGGGRFTLPYVEHRASVLLEAKSSIGVSTQNAAKLSSRGRINDVQSQHFAAIESRRFDGSALIHSEIEDGSFPGTTPTNGGREMIQIWTIPHWGFCGTMSQICVISLPQIEAVSSSGRSPIDWVQQEAQWTEIDGSTQSALVSRLLISDDPAFPRPRQGPGEHLPASPASPSSPCFPSPPHAPALAGAYRKPWLARPASYRDGRATLR